MKRLTASSSVTESLILNVLYSEVFASHLESDNAKERPEMIIELTLLVATTGLATFATALGLNSTGLAGVGASPEVPLELLTAVLCATGCASTLIALASTGSDFLPDFAGSKLTLTIWK